MSRLAFGDVFYLDRTVSSASDEVTSMTTRGASEQKGGFAFTTTHWSVVLEAQGESPAAQEALEKLCRTYRRGAQGKRTTSFLSAWGTKIFSRQRAASGDGG
ncbi:MAG: hypothetical protein DMF20_03280 [Verrucomicrobia bacterium]|nr:MAG: hypothetical protein DMF20_03280 [Verrucomicrobiota bacterium]